MNCKNTYEINKEEQCNESQLFFEIMVALLIYVHISSGGMVMFVLFLIFQVCSLLAEQRAAAQRRETGAVVIQVMRFSIPY